MKNKTIKALRLVTFVALAIVTSAEAGDVGHYNGGIMNIRDYFVPDPGVYGVVYNYFYTTDRLNDAHGNKIKSITIGATTVKVDVNVDMYAVAPALIWTTDIKPLGIKYGVYIAPSFVNANLDADLSIAEGVGGNINNASFGVGDLLVQPIWLGKTTPHWDCALSYGFYAPIGRYDTQTVTVPGVGPVKTESSDNIGYGFWTQQIQGSMAWYPMTDKATAVVAALTYGVNGKKQDFDVTPGDNLTLNWGISQFLPLKKDGSVLLEVGPGGYDTWQITDDTGSAANNTRDQVHAVGGQLGFTYVPWMATLNFLGYYEYAAKDRFQGASFSINIAKKF
jgi:hypothetical protein